MWSNLDVNGGGGKIYFFYVLNHGIFRTRMFQYKINLRMFDDKNRLSEMN